MAGKERRFIHCKRSEMWQDERMIERVFGVLEVYFGRHQIMVEGVNEYYDT